MRLIKTPRAALLAALVAFALLSPASGCDCGKPRPPKAKLSPKPKPKKRAHIKLHPQLRSQMKRLQKLFAEMKRRIGLADASRIVAAIKAVGDYMLTQQKGAPKYRELSSAFDLLQRRETAMGRFIALQVKRASERETHPKKKRAPVSAEERKQREAARAALQSAYRDVVELCIKCHERKARKTLSMVQRLRL